MCEVRMDDRQIQRNRYDAEDLRHEMEENGRLVQFLYSGEELEAERDEEEKVTRYIWGYQLISSDSESARTYYHYASDEMGSVTHVVEEEDRRVRNRYGYDAFGNTEYAEETVRNRFRYTGQQYDSVTGQYYLRARYYNPVIGRFLQEDTYYGDGLNLYAYCRNNPVRYYDPSGHDACPKALQDQMKGQGIPDVEIARNVERIQALIADGKMSIEDAYKQVTGRDYAGGGGSATKGSRQTTDKVPMPGDDDFIGPLTKSDNHFINGDGIGPKKRGVLGAHNLDSFNSTLESTGFPLDQLKMEGPVAHPTIEGIFSQEYRLPAYDGKGNIIGFKNIPDPKTVYDPAIISNSQMLEWGKEAMQNGVITGRIIDGTASNGLQFRGFIEDGIVTNFFPIIPK